MRIFSLIGLIYTAYNMAICKSVHRLDDEDRQLITAFIKGQWVIFGLGAFLLFVFTSVFLISLLGYIQIQEPGMLFLLILGIGTGILAFFMARQLWRDWQRKIKPLRQALKHDGQKIVYEGQLVEVSKLGKGRLMYRLENGEVSVDVILSAGGWAFTPKVIYTSDSMRDVPVVLHVLELPDGRQLLLQAVYAEEPVFEPAFQIVIKDNNINSVFSYLLLTVVFLFLLFVNLSGIFPLGILFGAFPATLLYIIALIWVKRKRKRLRQTIQIIGHVTEIISVPTRTQIMGEPSSSHQDTWFRINGKAYPIISNHPPKGISVGDSIELTVVKK